VQDWFIEVEGFGGPNSVINQISLNETSFVTRDALFLIQFYGYTDVDTEFPSSGFTLVDGKLSGSQAICQFD
jgi:hypothetical protein